MSFHWCDNLYTTVFTPRDYQVELLASAFERNTLICLGHKSSKEFIALKLLQEMSRKMQNKKKKKSSIFLTCSEGPGIDSMIVMLQHLTDLKVFRNGKNNNIPINDWPRNNEVYVLHPRIFHEALQISALKKEEIHLMIVDDCHEMLMYSEILPIIKEFFNTTEHVFPPPKILGLGGPLHSASCTWHELSAMLKILEENIHCTAETASDIVTVLRYCSKPIEYIVQCAPYSKDDLALLLEDIINTRKAFLNNHRYDPTEIYNTDEFLEELKDIPDPKKEPLEYLNIVETVLREMGPWCADRVALNLYHRIEKQKIKTPHERHFILLCLVNTTFVQIHTICEQTFRQITDHKQLVEQYSSPKVLRLLEILRAFKPDEFRMANDKMKRMHSALDTMDFQKVTRAIEQSCQSVEHIAKQHIASQSIVENLDPIVKRSSSELSSDYAKTAYYAHLNVPKAEHAHRHRGGSNNNQTGRGRRRVFVRRHKQQHDANDTLCAIIFCNTNHTARVLFDMLAEMSRNDGDLHYLKCQFIADRIANPLTEPKEAENEHRRQEDVLKKFRMRDCNVLIGTSVLEEGIDVPKCNLVVRWDKPNTYRSYVQGKGRARATPSYHIILVSPHTSHDDDNEKPQQQQQQQQNAAQHQAELLSKRSHKYICQLPEHDNDSNAHNLQSDFSSTTEEEEVEEEDNQLKRYTRTSTRGIVKILNPEVIRYKSAKQLNTPMLPTAMKMITAGVENVKELAENACESKLSLVEIKTDEEDFIKEEYKEEMENDKPNVSRVSTILLETKNESLANCFNMFELNERLENLTLNESVSKENMQETSNTTTTTTTVQQITLDSDSMKIKCQKKLTKIKRQPKCYICDKNEQQENKEPMELRFFELELKQMEKTTCAIVNQLAQYQEIEKMLLRKCSNVEPTETEHQHADKFTRCIDIYKPLSDLLTGAFVDLSNSIALVNKYCSKLPSDTFTKLTALWRCAKTLRNGVDMYQYTIRLPINSPLKYDIVGLPMPTNVLARRVAALKACIELHKCGELDNYLQPIGKEGFKAIESDWENFELEAQDEQIVQNNCEPRPGTTKRRQYYYKRIASEFCDCRPTANTPSYLYLLDLTLQCPIPEEQNTRGRKIYPPEEAQQGFGILTLKKIPKVSSFPIFTRSGEVKVSIELATEHVVLSEKQIQCINTFVNYTFTNVLRLQKFLMLFDPDSTENCIFIVPTIKTKTGKTIDWNFLSLIEENASKMPTCVSEDERKDQEFDAQKFKDAVVMPWYRNQDQPQYFYVAEICPNLTPLSCFPGETYNTFKHYYFLKYGLNIQNTKQPLLDVDHTSARLNFLTPRYVNRKGVALPTSSEETKRAKRENLEQKQILVPELCTVHPFPASLWRTAVCLPCILYRINGLLLADDIRKKVSADIGLGKQQVNDKFEWPMLDFGWSLSEVLRKTKEIKMENKIKDTTVEPENKHELHNSSNNNNNNSKKRKSKNDNQKSEKSANEIIMEGEKKLLDSSLVEIGTWSNEMADDINIYDSDDSDDDIDNDNGHLNYLPPNVSFCDPKTRYGSPTFWDVKKSSQLKTDGHARKENIKRNWYDTDELMAAGTQDGENNWYSDDDDNDEDDDDDDYYDDDDDDNYDDAMENDGLLHIAFNSKHEAETLETEQDIEKRKRQLSIIQATNVNERNYQETKNLKIGYNFDKLKSSMQQKLQASRCDFVESTSAIRKQIENSNMLVKYNEKLHLVHKDDAVNKTMPSQGITRHTLEALLPYVPNDELNAFLRASNKPEACMSLEQIEELNGVYIAEHEEERFTILSCGDIFDNFNDKHCLEIENDEYGVQVKKTLKINFQNSHKLIKTINHQIKNSTFSIMTNGNDNNDDKYTANRKAFSFSDQPELLDHAGPSPSIILQALTMSNANDGINLERLETIGDSFLKYAITTYLYITYENVHEGKLSHLRSKQVANLNLYRLGRRKMLGEYMIATKFEPHDNWLPPCYYVPKQLEKALIEAKIPPHHWKYADLQNIKKLTSTEICALVREKADELELDKEYKNDNEKRIADSYDENISADNFTCFIPYNLVTQHSIPDKSVADCVEALIGAYLIECGTRGALLFMAWLGIRVLPYERKLYNAKELRIPGSTCPDADNMITVYGEWTPPCSPLLHYTPNAEQELHVMLEGFDAFEKILGYKFHDRSYLLQAMTHASYSPNRLTDCYQRLEFLGDAVLDYLITRHLYEDPRQHSPGALTDLRSALVNNTIFASLAVRHGFHKYFRHLSPGLNDVIDRFVRIQNENGHCISEEYYLLSEEECDDAEDVEVPKALGDVFESIAGAIFLDSNMSLDTVWKIYSNMMKPEIEQFSNSVPKSPIRELLELEPETAKFGKPEKLADGRRVRVTVDVFCKGTFRGIGRNYRIAKCTAAKCALRQLKKQGLISKKD